MHIPRWHIQRRRLLCLTAIVAALGFSALTGCSSLTDGSGVLGGKTSSPDYSTIEIRDYEGKRLNVDQRGAGELDQGPAGRGPRELQAQDHRARGDTDRAELPGSRRDAGEAQGHRAELHRRLDDDVPVAGRLARRPAREGGRGGSVGQGAHLPLRRRLHQLPAARLHSQARHHPRLPDERRDDAAGARLPVPGRGRGPLGLQVGEVGQGDRGLQRRELPGLLGEARLRERRRACRARTRRRSG